MIRAAIANEDPIAQMHPIPILRTWRTRLLAPGSRGRCLLRRAAGLALAALTLAAPGALADEAEPGDEIPIVVPQRADPAQRDLTHLWEWRDKTLQNKLEAAMHRIGLTPALERGRLSVALVDITDRLHPKVSAINGDKMFYAASLPKIIVMLAVFEKVEAGELTIDQETHEQLYRMIRISSNSDSTALMQKVGKKYIADLVRSPRYLLYDPSHNGGLWAGKDYGSGGLWRRDPVHNLSHGATTMQVARFFYLLETGKLVTPLASLEMKQILERKGDGKKFVKGIRQVQPDAKIHRKGGTWRNFHADAALVFRTDGAAYIAAGLSESEDGREWLTNVAIAMDGLIESPAP
jgi:beta-lactamase class A